MKCGRRVCHNSATHYNLSTGQYYCTICANNINLWSHQDHNKTICYPVAVCCVIRKVDQPEQILLVSRKNDQAKFGLPGGKMEPGETPYQAIRREVLEETGLTIALGHLVFEDVCIKHTPSGRDYYALAYLATSYTGKISTNESGVVKWGTWEDQEPGPFTRFNKGVRNALAANYPVTNHPVTRKELEWAGSSPLSRRNGVGMCLWCGQLQNQGHDPQCAFLDPNKTIDQIRKEIQCST